MGKTNAKSVKIINGDARDCNVHLKGKTITLTITSPPYYDLKDYGNNKQIGYGQSFDEYKKDLTKIFTEIYKHTKEGGSLWAVIDTYMKNGEIVMLPFIFAELMKGIGWKHKEIIIWQKDKTVPWIHSGQLRNVFEYILVFSKGKNLELNIDAVRDYANLKDWWIKYPERYNPMGKAPTTIWDFPIPVQGAWSSNNVRHFCPLPEGLVSQIIRIASSTDDLVFDPFSGSGVVLLEAQKQGRQALGVELNKHYVAKISERVSEQKIKYIEPRNSNQERFKKTIVELRALKIAKYILDHLRKEIGVLDSYIYAKLNRKGDFKGMLGELELTIVLKSSNRRGIDVKLFDDFCVREKLTTYGLRIRLCCSDLRQFSGAISYYMYDSSSFYKKIGMSKSFSDHNVIYSNINLNLDLQR